MSPHPVTGSSLKKPALTPAEFSANISARRDDKIFRRRYENEVLKKIIFGLQASPEPRELFR